MCNDVRNCKFGWDEESCGDKEGGVSLDFSSPTVFMILIVLILILMGMCAGMLLSFRRTLKEDEEEDEEEGEDNDGVDGGHSGADSPSLAVISNSNHKIGESTPRLPTSLPPSLHSKRPLPPHAHHDIYPSNDDSNAGNGGASGGCYVPDGGFALNARFWPHANHNILPYNKMQNYYQSQPLRGFSHEYDSQSFDDPCITNHISNHVPNTLHSCSSSNRSINYTRYKESNSCPHICQYDQQSSSSIKRYNFKHKKSSNMCHHKDLDNYDQNIKPCYHMRTWRCQIEYITIASAKSVQLQS